ncbi:MAG: germination protein YpeB [Clostridia bacterium]|nr:germination protein YpeB [Clostridia bacterium]
MKENTKKVIMTLIIIVLAATIAWLGYQLYNKKQESINASQNLYNHALYELVDYMQNVESYLAKATISTGATHGAETMTNLWREANLAQTYLSMLPMESQDLENTAKFLNQVSDYSYSLSRKNIKGEKLTDDDLKNLQDLYKYSVELNNVVNQISSDLNSGNISWKDLTGDENIEFAQQVNSDLDLASTLEENFHEYSGLIYDGAYSEHITTKEKKGLTGKDINEDEGIKIVEDFLGKDNIEQIDKLGLSENAETPVYTYSLKTKDEDNVTITVSKKGGHIVYLNSNRDVSVENLSNDEAKNKGLDFLKEKGLDNMKETYYLKESGILTVNYAYKQGDVIVYPDLVKLKIALDNGEILGMETTGYLNNHRKRDVSKTKITKEEAKKKLNKNLDIVSEGLAIIPTEWKTEILCYEFKGKINDTDYLVYINANTGEEEDILVIVNTPNGILTM